MVWYLVKHRDNFASLTLNSGSVTLTSEVRPILHVGVNDGRILGI